MIIKTGIIILLLYLIFNSSIRRLFFKKNRKKVNSSGIKYEDAEFEEID